jgi:hypothetical protein
MVACGAFRLEKTCVRGRSEREGAEREERGRQWEKGGSDGGGRRTEGGKGRARVCR